MLKKPATSSRSPRIMSLSPLLPSDIPATPRACQTSYERGNWPRDNANRWQISSSRVVGGTQRTGLGASRTERSTSCGNSQKLPETISGCSPSVQDPKPAGPGLECWPVCVSQVEHASRRECRSRNLQCLIPECVKKNTCQVTLSKIR